MAAQPFRPVGVIGGMGPEATVLLMARIIAATPAEDDSDHIPLLVDSNPQVPSRIKALIEKTGESPAPTLVKMAQRLEAIGAQALAMPCNTAHYYAPQIRAAVRIPLLDMVDLSLRRARDQSHSTPQPVIGMLCSPAVRITGSFSAPAEAMGLALHYLSDDRPLLELIRRVKKTGASREARDELAAICKQFQAEGVTLLLVACSELSLITDAIPTGMAFVDAIDVLAKACVDFSRGLIKEQENAA